MSKESEIAESIEALLERPGESRAPGVLLDAGLAALPVLKDYLVRDLDIARAEVVESLLKQLLQRRFSTPVTGRDARVLALFQRELGFVQKYKSYAIKAASPLGYSIFLQNQGEGFSYQRHVTHKTEVFHVLDVMPGGFVFLCDFSDWEKHYDERVFQAWLDGEAHPFFDRCRFTPEPGDVFVISELGTVHTVVGCILEEYATVSTDMVVRLHDQNAGKAIPAHFNRAYAEERLGALRLPDRNRVVDILSEPPSFAPVEPEPVPGGDRRVLTDSFVTATLYRLAPQGRGAIQSSGERVTSLRIFQGRGTLAIADGGELDRLDEVAFEIAKNDIFLIAPGLHYRLIAEGGEQLAYSEHQITPSVAFV